MYIYYCYFFCLISDFALAFRSPIANHPVNLRRKLTVNSKTSDSTELLNDLEQLKLEREKKKAVLAATELAIRSLEAEITKSDNNISNPKVLPYDYGFISKSSGCYVNTKTPAGESLVPESAVVLGTQSFKRELNSIGQLIGKLFGKDANNSKYDDPILRKLSQVKLSNKAIWDREARRPQVKAPLIIKIPYLILCVMLDVLFDGYPISRFWFLETVARMPYFSYITMLHTYETLGWWRRSAEAKRVHFAEEWNEYHHLLIMESLGGDQQWAVRFLAQHSAIVYFFILIIAWLLSPTVAYNFSELIESHAVDTYAEFAESNRELLMELPPPEIAIAYYEGNDMYAFDEFQTSRPKGSRRPKIENLYDVFCNIHDDEGEHVATMAACQDPDILIKSPNTEAAVLTATLAAAAIAYLISGDIDFNGLTQYLDFAGDNALDTISNTIGGDAAGDAIGAAAAGMAAVSEATSNAPQILEENSEFLEEGSFLFTILKFLKIYLPIIM